MEPTSSCEINPLNRIRREKVSILLVWQLKDQEWLCIGEGKGKGKGKKRLLSNGGEDKRNTTSQSAVV